MPFYNKKPAPTPAPANSGASAKTLGFFTGIITIVLGINTLVVGCSNRKIEEEKSHREYIQAEEDFWAKKYAEFADIVRMDPGKADRMSLLRSAYFNAGMHFFDPNRAGIQADSLRAKAFYQMQIVYLSNFQLERGVLIQSEYEELNDISKLVDRSTDEFEEKNIEFRREHESLMNRRIVPFSVSQTRTEQSNDYRPNAPTTDQPTTGAATTGTPPTNFRPSENILATGVPTGYDFDIFWCDATENAVAQRNYDEALRSGNALAAKANRNGTIAHQAIGRVRVRMLPIELQGQGYPSPMDSRTQGLSIRPDSRFATENTIASELLNMEPWKSAGYRPLPGSSASQWYISMFVCYALPQQ